MNSPKITRCVALEDRQRYRLTKLLVSPQLGSSKKKVSYGFRPPRDLESVADRVRSIAISCSIYTRLRHLCLQTQTVPQSDPRISTRILTCFSFSWINAIYPSFTKFSNLIFDVIIFAGFNVPFANASTTPRKSFA